MKMQVPMQEAQDMELLGQIMIMMNDFDLYLTNWGKNRLYENNK